MAVLTLPSWISGFGGLKRRNTASKKLDFSALDVVLRKYTAELPNSLQGVTFSAFNNKGETIYSNAAGTQFLESESDQISTKTPVWTSSITKLITTLACVIAVEQGLIELDENAREIVPELKSVQLLAGFEGEDSDKQKPVLKDILQPITIRQLLSHTSGYTYDVFDAGLMKWSRTVGRTTFSHCGSMAGNTHPLILEPGKGWAYGPGIDWAGRALEIRSGVSLEEFMQKNIFSKLDMKDTTFFPEKRDGYLDRKMNHATRNPQTGALMPGGGHHLLGLPAQDCIGGMGLYSTPEDIVKLLKVMLCGDGSIIKRESVAEMLKPQLDDVTQAAFMEVIDGKAKYHLRQTWPEGHDGTFGLSASINLQDFSGRRLKNSMNWAGSSGLHAWIDPTSGIGGLITTQLAPPGDKMFTQCLLDLETALYTELRASKRIG